MRAIKLKDKRLPPKMLTKSFGTKLRHNDSRLDNVHSASVKLERLLAARYDNKNVMQTVQALLFKFTDEVFGQIL